MTTNHSFESTSVQPLFNCSVPARFSSLLFSHPFHFMPLPFHSLCTHLYFFITLPWLLNCSVPYRPTFTISTLPYTYRKRPRTPIPSAHSVGVRLFVLVSVGIHLPDDSVDVTSEPLEQVSAGSSLQHTTNKNHQLEVQLGGTVTLQCPQGSLGCWSHLDPVNARLRGLGAGSSIPTGVYSLKDVVYQDAGTYKCVGQSPNNKKKLDVLHTLSLNVKGMSLLSSVSLSWLYVSTNMDQIYVIYAVRYASGCDFLFRIELVGAGHTGHWIRPNEQQKKEKIYSIWFYYLIDIHNVHCPQVRTILESRERQTLVVCVCEECWSVDM